MVDPNVKDPGELEPRAGKGLGAAASSRPPAPAPSTDKSRAFGARAREFGVVSGPLPQYAGGRDVALAPTVRGVKRELCKRLGVRYADLDAAGREAVDLYARARAKLAAIDNWLTDHPMLDEKGEPAGWMTGGDASTTFGCAGSSASQRQGSDSADRLCRRPRIVRAS
jgi:hypothetical protein